MQNNPDYILIPFQVIADESIEPVAEKLYGIIYWYTRMLLKKCFVSNSVLAEMLNTSPRTIQNSLDSLEKAGYIKRIFKDKSRRHRSEIVPLLTFSKQSETAVTPEKQSAMAVTQTEMAVTLERNGGDQSININNNNKEDNTGGKPPGMEVAVKKVDEVNEAIDSFKEVNPSFEKLFKNKTQRAATANLIKIHGLDKLKRVIALLRKTNHIPYMPSITTPVQLEDKWASLESALIKKKAEDVGRRPKGVKIII